MGIVGYFSYTAIETCIVEIRISKTRIFYTSDLKWPKAIQVAERRK